jgi:hypothetical protein
MNNDLDEILAYLDYIQSQKRMVSVVSTFKGVSFSIIVHIVNVSHKEKEVTISSPPQQNMSLLPNTRVAIHSDLFPYPVLANVSKVETQRKTAVLRPLEYVRGLDDNRTHVRVQTKEDTPVSIDCEEGYRFTASIHDVSTDGISIIFDEVTSEIEEVLQAGKLSRLNFRLQLADTPAPHSFNFTAKTVYVTLLNNGNCRIGLQTYPTPRDIIALRRYIFDRQTELFQEISNPSSKSILT